VEQPDRILLGVIAAASLAQTLVLFALALTALRAARRGRRLREKLEAFEPVRSDVARLRANTARLGELARRQNARLAQLREELGGRWSELREVFDASATALTTLVSVARVLRGGQQRRA
jgi:hypothetical protein